MPSENEIAELRKAAQAAVDVDAMTVSEFRDKYEFPSSVSCFSFVASMASEALAHRPPSPPRPRDEAEADWVQRVASLLSNQRHAINEVWVNRRGNYADYFQRAMEWSEQAHYELTRIPDVRTLRDERDAAVAQADRLQALLAESMTREGAYVKELTKSRGGKPE